MNNKNEELFVLFVFMPKLPSDLDDRNSTLFDLNLCLTPLFQDLLDGFHCGLVQNYFLTPHLL